MLVSSAGTIASFYLRYKDQNGKTCHEKIGRTTDIDLVTARKQAKTLKAEISLGADPRAADKAKKAVITFKEFFEEHYLPYVKPRKRSWKRDEGLYRLRIKAAFGDKRLNQLSRQAIQTFHTELLATGLAPASCDHHIKLMKHALNLAIDWEMIDKNPAARIPLYSPDNRVENLLSDADLDRLLTVLRTDENRPVCLIALFLLSTGARLNEALQAKWVHIQKEDRRWNVPMGNSKSKRSRWVPLNESAYQVLNEVGTEGKYEHVFVNKQTGTAYTSINRVWTRLRKKAQLTHFRIHDLRHGFATMLASSGRSLIEIGELLGHSKNSASVTNRYIHVAQGRLHEAANVASMKIMETAPATPKQDIPKSTPGLPTGVTQYPAPEAPVS